VVLSRKLSPVTEKEQDQMNWVPYLSLSMVGSLMYASMATCPEITYTVSHMGKYSENTSQAHWTVAQCVIHYLNGTTKG